ncbi:PepSY domain-containing protein [Ferrimonas lipolytica]|uniref:Peptidase n=1 Tax=Ferrimonas lipolytica TaxID=2724191 RepID=A0A6H1UFA4_9GAMM|nr:PepSY domain-containing protein [Ferrimonas lipolytica]QIZ77280.1 peptidase [Ferrimonas lipolytica]
MPLLNTRGLRWWHRFAGTLVAIQLLLWLLTGIYFNLTPHDQLKGMAYHCGHEMPSQKLPLSTFALVEPSQLLASYPNTERVSLTLLAGKPHYLLTHQQRRYLHQCQQQTLLDAQTGAVAHIDKLLAMTLASDTYMGPGTAFAATQVAGQASEWPKQCNLLWRVDFDDALQTRVYLDASSGQLVGHKNSDTDIADWMFRLHFMDYFNQGSFNNPFTWLFSLMSLLLVGSGLLSISDNCQRQRYRR